MEAIEKRGGGLADREALKSLLGRIENRIQQWNQGEKQLAARPPVADRVDPNQKVRRLAQRIRSNANLG